MPNIKVTARLADKSHDIELVFPDSIDACTAERLAAGFAERLTACEAAVDRAADAWVASNDSRRTVGQLHRAVDRAWRDAVRAAWSELQAGVAEAEQLAGASIRVH